MEMRHLSCPFPHTYVIGIDRKIRKAFVDSDYTMRLDPEHIIDVLKKVKDILQEMRLDVPEKKLPQVSVIIPSYNHERYVGEAIESVLAQSMGDFEIIVVDDGSSDGSVDVVRQFKDARIRIFVQSNSGAHNAMNRGATLASAQWIAFLNSDDKFHPNKLERHLCAHKDDPSLEASASRVRYITETGEPVMKDGYLAMRYKNISGFLHSMIHCLFHSSW